MTLCQSDVDCWWHSPYCVNYLSGFGPSPWYLSICLCYYYFYKVHVWHILFLHFWILIRCPLQATWGSGATVAPMLPWGSQSHYIGVSLVFSGLHSVSLLGLAFFWKLCSVFSGRSRACLLGVHLSLFSVLPERFTGSPLRTFPTLFFSGRSSSPGELNGLANWFFLVSGFQIWTGCFPHPLHWFFLDYCCACSRRLQIPAGLIILLYGFLLIVIQYA